MAIYLPGTAEDQPLSLDEMSLREIVATKITLLHKPVSPQ